MVITPNSDIILLKSPLKLDHENQITFSNATEQYNYFNSLPKLSVNGATYQRKDGVIRFPTHTKENDNLPVYEDILKYNYCMYRNTNYSNKWFYAYVVDITYQNDGMTEVKIETDVFQTWQFDIVYMNSFIEREHVSDDTIGLHTIPEGLETGEYIINTAGKVETELDSCYICVGVTDLTKVAASVSGWNPLIYNNRIYGGIYSGLTYVLFADSEATSKFINKLTDSGYIDMIACIFMIPEKMTGVDYASTYQTWPSIPYGDGTTFKCTTVTNYLGPKVIRNDITLTSPSTIDGYTPRNNKCFVYPYNVLSITNNAGTQVEYRYEDFVNNTPLFYLYGSLVPSGAGKLFPVNYKKYSDANYRKATYNWGMNIGKYPMCSWNVDQYTNWQVTNGINIGGVRIKASEKMALGGLFEGVLGAASIKASSGESLGQMGEGIGKIFNAAQENYRHSLDSPTLEGQTGSGDMQFTAGEMSPTYYKMTVRAEYIKTIDDFFTMYGYKVNRLSSINIHKRSNWDFIKCSNVNLEGEIPEGDLDKIRRLFNNGCTFWHTTQYYLDYSRTNSIL